MKRKSRTALPVSPAESPLRHLPLVDLLVDTKTELLELALRSGLKVFTTMLEEDRAAICGPRYAHEPDRLASRAVRLEFPILSGESAPPVWRQPNVDHVGSWRATAPRRPAAPSRHVCSGALLDSHPVSAKRPEGRRRSAHDCPCWRVTPLLLSNGSPRAVGFPSHASPYQLARRRRP